MCRVDYQGSSAALNLYDDPEFWHGESDHKWSRRPDTVNRAINCMRESIWVELTKLFGGIEPSNEEVITLIKEENKFQKFDGYIVVWINENLSLQVWG